MSNFKIVSDATTDLSPALVKELDVHIVPMLFTVDGKDYYHTPDDRDISNHAFYELLRNGKTSTTTPINSETFKNEFTPFLHDRSEEHTSQPPSPPSNS